MMNAKIGDAVQVWKWGGKWNGVIDNITGKKAHVKFEDGDEATVSVSELKPVTTAKMIAVLSEHFTRVGEVSLDERNRVSLTKALESLKRMLGAVAEEPSRFSVFVNEAGQLLLSPEVSVPMHELWLYRNPQALRMVLKGLEEARKGEHADLGSFEKYADDDID